MSLCDHPHRFGDRARLADDLDASASSALRRSGTGVIVDDYDRVISARLRTTSHRRRVRCGSPHRHRCGASGRHRIAYSVASGGDRVGIEAGAPVVDVDGDTVGFASSEHGYRCARRMSGPVQQCFTRGGKESLNARVDGRVAHADDLDLGSELILNRGRDRASELASESESTVLLRPSNQSRRSRSCRCARVVTAAGSPARRISASVRMTESCSWSASSARLVRARARSARPRAAAGAAATTGRRRAQVPRASSRSPDGGADVVKVDRVGKDEYDASDRERQPEARTEQRVIVRLVVVLVSQDPGRAPEERQPRADEQARPRTVIPRARSAALAARTPDSASIPVPAVVRQSTGRARAPLSASTSAASASAPAAHASGAVSSPVADTTMRPAVRPNRCTPP